MSTSKRLPLDFSSVPLQMKKLQRLETPWLHVGLCEVTNMNSQFPNASFLTGAGLAREGVPNSRHDEASSRFLAGGLFDSYTGPHCSRFISSFLQDLFEHHALPAKLKQERLKSIDPAHPLHGALHVLHSIKAPRLVDPKYQQPLATAADVAFRQAFGQRPIQEGGQLRVIDSGCRGVWFSAEETDGAVEVVLSNVGDCRAFGIVGNERTSGVRSLLDESRETVFPLSMDHVLDRQDEFSRVALASTHAVQVRPDFLLNGAPTLNVSRSFGHWFAKEDPKRSLVMQQLTAVPSSFQKTLLPGDAVLLANFSCFVTRSGKESHVDPLATVVGSALRSGASAEDAAAAVCDYAVRYGAPHSLQAMVVHVPPTAGSSSSSDLALPPKRTSRVIPGPLYRAVCRNLPGYYSALVDDCSRCDITIDDMLRLRWAELGPHIAELRRLMATSPLRGLFPRDFGTTMNHLEDEVAFFEGGPEQLLQRGSPDSAVDAYFHRLSKSLQPSR